VYVNSSQTVETAQTVESNITLFKDGVPCSEEGWEIVNPTGAFPGTISCTTTKLEWSFDKDTNISSNNYAYPITLKKGDIQLTKDFKLKRLVGTADYDLFVDT
jgi:hypothetical protein